MINLNNGTVEIVLNDEDGTIFFTDIKRNAHWRLDNGTLFYEIKNGSGTRRDFLMFEKAEVSGSKLIAKYTGKIEKLPVTYEYTLRSNCIEIKLLQKGTHESLAEVAMPSSLIPATDEKKYLFPIMQGMLWDTRGEAFEKYWGEA